MKLNSTQFSFLLAMLFASTTMFAQFAQPLDIADQYVRANLDQWELTTGDIQDMTVSDMYTDQKTGISRVYYNQQYNGVPIYNAILNVNITNKGQVFFSGNSFEGRISEKVNTTLPIINAEQAVERLALHLGLSVEKPILIEQPTENEFVFDKGNMASENIKVSLKYQKTDDAVRLAWNVTLIPIKSSDMWDSRVDATTGKVLDETNWTVYCQVDGHSFKRTGQHDCSSHAHTVGETGATAAMLTGASYNVWPIPVESPIHGDRAVVKDPHLVTASPFGWHDVNGADGAEYTITRGNNVHAYQDTDSDNASSGDEPDGGMDLNFDFSYDANLEPSDYIEAATVNLFYMNNIMHDVSYIYGFDEAAGNFQANNYGNGGAGGDFVNAEAQDGSGTNNANFATPADGQNPRMQMFRWDLGSTSGFKVTEPASIAGDYDYSGTTWSDGSDIDTATAIIDAEVAIVDDGIFDPLTTDACEDILNGPELAGKVAIIDRGGCEFGFKAVQAQNEGAIAVIICNFEDNPANMGAGAVGGDVTVPTISLGSSDCSTIRQFVGTELRVTFQLPVQQTTGPSQVDSDLDNGVIAHEFGHGISIRLTGGPANVGCLGGSEQMGEGWSDFMSLITSAKAGDSGAMPRGIGNYSAGLQPDGGGIRHYPYTTDMNINPLTYGQIPNESVPHGVGAAWCTILWDMYWAFADKDGFETDVYADTGTSGNNYAIQLVFDGMKNQPCLPGFVTGRDGILAADIALSGGANQCLIWETFARRGVGVNAIQGTNDVGDEVENFEVPCECRDKITISKSMDDYVDPGEEFNVTLMLSNCKNDPISGIQVTDELPDGAEFVPGSSNVPGTVQGNAVVFDIPMMPFGSEQTITYKLKSDPNKPSKLLWLDPITQDSEDEWDIGFTGTPNTIWTVTTQFGAHTGDRAWWVNDTDTENFVYFGQMEGNGFTVSGDRPALRFWHKFNTEVSLDGGWIEIKKVGDIAWQVVPDRMIRNGYTGALSYNTFVIPNLVGFSGDSGDEFAATYVDISDWMGETIQVRFRFGNDTGAEVDDGGWLIDDIEYQDMFSYNSEACVTTAEGDNACAIAPNEGTIVESAEFNNTVEKLQDVTITTYPNPVNNLLNIGIDSERQQELEMSLLTLDGKVVSGQTFNLIGKQTVQVDVSSFPAGFYFLKIATEEGSTVQKIVIE